MPPTAPLASSEVVVFCESRGSLERIRSRFPSTEVVDITDGVPSGRQGDVLFGGFGPRSVEAMQAGVRWVQLTGTGIDRLPAEVRAAPVLTTARGASAVAISEYVITVMGAFARDFPDNWLREAPEHWFFQQATTLAGATVGLFGFGGIAQRVARVALALEMHVIALRRHPGPSVVAGVEIVSALPDLLCVADHLVLAAPATDATHHVINAESLRLVRPGAHLVNIARGSLVDQDALRVALDDGTFARASLDVTDPEPLPEDHWLFTHPKVFLTPHASWAGPPVFETSTEFFCDNLERFLAGQPLHGIVGPDGY
jgi:phosphoglycerate dehydrogenase-like enzyme